MMKYQSWDFCKSVKCNAMLYSQTLREENDLQRASIQELSRQLAEAQGDNAKLRKECSWTNHFIGAAAKGLLEIHDIITDCFPGDSINRPKFDYAKKIDKIADDFLNKPHPGASLLADLEYLRKVRDAASKIDFVLFLNILNSKEVCEPFSADSLKYLYKAMSKTAYALAGYNTCDSCEISNECGGMTGECTWGMEGEHES